MALSVVKYGSILLVSLTNALDGVGAPVNNTNATAWITILDTGATSQGTALPITSMPWLGSINGWQYPVPAAIFTRYREIEIEAQLYDISGLAGILLDSETAFYQVGG